MIEIIKSENLYVSNQGWLESHFHFSFAEYIDPNNLGFKSLRVVNDDIINPESGFGMHPHRDMEIITYVIDGYLTHQDSMGNKETLKNGEVQYMSAGTGIFHSEMNDHKEKEIRLLQIWIKPDKKDYRPVYGSEKFQKFQRTNQLLKIVSSYNDDGVVKINQDASIVVSESDKDIEYNYEVGKNRGIYFVCIDGVIEINGSKLETRDAAKIYKEDKITIKAAKGSHFLFLDLK